MPFTRTDTRRAAETALAETEAKIAELEHVRAEKLLEADYAGAVDAIDVQIAAHRRAAVVHRDRIATMVVKRRTDERARLEREKADAIAKLRAPLARRDTAAVQVDAKIEALIAAVAELERADEAVFAHWSPALTIQSYRLDGCRVAALGVLSERDAGPQDHWGLNERRRIVGVLRGLIKRAPINVAEAVSDQCWALIEALQDEPIAEAADDGEYDDTEVAA